MSRSINCIKSAFLRLVFHQDFHLFSQLRVTSVAGNSQTLSDSKLKKNPFTSECYVAKTFCVHIRYLVIATPYSTTPQYRSSTAIKEMGDHFPPFMSLMSCAIVWIDGCMVQSLYKQDLGWLLLESRSMRLKYVPLFHLSFQIPPSRFGLVMTAFFSHGS